MLSFRAAINEIAAVKIVTYPKELFTARYPLYYQQSYVSEWFVRMMRRLYTAEKLGSAIGKATKVLGYTSWGKTNYLSLKHFLRGSDVFVSMPTGSQKLLYYCLLPIFSILQQVDDTTHNTHTYTATWREARVNAVTNHVTEVTAWRRSVQRKHGRTDILTLTSIATGKKCLALEATTILGV